MPATPREIVQRCLRRQHPPRTPRDLWTLPWANTHHPAAVATLRQRFPSDFGGVPDVYRPAPRRRGDPYAVGTYTDEWGCVFTNIHAGVIGEVRAPLLASAADWRQLKPPIEMLPDDAATARATVNRACEASQQFVLSPCIARPWERYQFIRGSADAMMDVADGGKDVRTLLRRIQEFYLRDLRFWVTTNVDAVMFMDDWGAQRQLLISPAAWRALFKPLYREYCQLIHAAGKFAFMHSDGHIAAIYPDLIEIGVDAVNSQLFCMDLAELARVAKGKITFWGEMDRQHVLPAADPAVGRAAVREVARHLYDPAGGQIAQFEFGAGANPATALAIFEEWEAVDREHAGKQGVK